MRLSTSWTVLGHLSDSHYRKYSLLLSISIGSRGRAMYTFEIKYLFHKFCAIWQKTSLFFFKWVSKLCWVICQESYSCIMRRHVGQPLLWVEEITVYQIYTSKLMKLLLYFYKNTVLIHGEASEVSFIWSVPKVVIPISHASNHLFNSECKFLTHIPTVISYQTVKWSNWDIFFPLDLISKTFTVCPTTTTIGTCTSTKF